MTCREDEEKRRFRVGEWSDPSRHREPLNQTCPEPEETGHKRRRPESGRLGSEYRVYAVPSPLSRRKKGG